MGARRERGNSRTGIELVAGGLECALVVHVHHIAIPVVVGQGAKLVSSCFCFGQVCLHILGLLLGNIGAGNGLGLALAVDCLSDFDTKLIGRKNGHGGRGQEGQGDEELHVGRRGSLFFGMFVQGSMQGVCSLRFVTEFGCLAT